MKRFDGQKLFEDRALFVPSIVRMGVDDVAVPVPDK